MNVGHLLHVLEQEKDSFQEMGISQQLEIEITNAIFSVIRDTVAFIHWHVIYAQALSTAQEHLGTFE